MKKKDLAELKSRNIEDLKKKINELTSEIIVNKLELKMGKIKNVHLVNNKKKDLARIKTILKLKYFETGKLNMSRKKAGENVAS